MISQSPKVAIIGGGPVGYYLATLLCLKNYSVILFDTQSPWERQLGTGIFSSESLDLPVIEEFSSPHQVSSLKFLSASGKEAIIELPDTYRLYAPEDLEQILKERLRDFDGQVVTSRVFDIKRVQGVWQIQTSEGDFEANFVVGADGFSSLVRKALNFSSPQERVSIEVSLDLPQEFGQEATIQFFDDMPGYFWIFPRTGRTVVGLWGTDRYLQARHLFEKMDALIHNILQIPVAAGVSRHVARLPIFEKFVPKETAGIGWALVGEAANLIDPLSGEGFLSGLKSAALLAEAFDGKTFSAKRYLASLQKDVVSDLKRKKFLARIFYKKWVLEWMISKGASRQGTRRFFRNQFLAAA